jgi:hypothetical protein
LEPKIQIWVNFGGSCNGRCWNILWTFGIYYGHLEYIMDIWYILWKYGIFCGNLVHFPRFGMLYREKSGNLGANANKQKNDGKLLLFFSLLPKK